VDRRARPLGELRQRRFFLLSAFSESKSLSCSKTITGAAAVTAVTATAARYVARHKMSSGGGHCERTEGEEEEEEEGQPPSFAGRGTGAAAAQSTRIEL
jgi:hypothetical protein